jgi:hypothetical protein
MKAIPYAEGELHIKYAVATSILRQVLEIRESLVPSSSG